MSHSIFGPAYIVESPCRQLFYALRDAKNYINNATSLNPFLTQDDIEKALQRLDRQFSEAIKALENIVLMAVNKSRYHPGSTREHQLLHTSIFGTESQIRDDIQHFKNNARIAVASGYYSHREAFLYADSVTGNRVRGFWGLQPAGHIAFLLRSWSSDLVFKLDQLEAGEHIGELNTFYDQEEKEGISWLKYVKAFSTSYDELVLQLFSEKQNSSSQSLSNQNSNVLELTLSESYNKTNTYYNKEELYESKKDSY